MHDTAYEIGQKFLEIYWRHGFSRILDVGSRDVNGTLRDFCPQSAEYVGIDLEPGTGVDVVLDDPGSFPFGDASFDVVLSTSCFEHDQMFWLTFAEMARVLRPGGYIYINAPSNGLYHSYPYDNWRFYPDAGLALEAWAKKLKIKLKFRESFTTRRKSDVWNDFIMVFRKTGGNQKRTQRHLSDYFPDALNIRRSNVNSISNISEFPEDMLLLAERTGEIGHFSGELETMRATLAERTRDVAALKAALSEAETQTRQLIAELSSRDEEVANLKSRLLSSDGEVERRSTRLIETEGQLAHLEKQRLSLLNSYSWRFTHPIRKARQLLHWATGGKKREQRKNLQTIRDSRLFDELYYMQNNLDLHKDNAFNPLLHFLLYGGFEGRSPSEFFETTWYLQQYPDIHFVRMNPLLHYIKHGMVEGRLPKNPANNFEKPQLATAPIASAASISSTAPHFPRPNSRSLIKKTFNALIPEAIRHRKSGIAARAAHLNSFSEYQSQSTDAIVTTKRSFDPRNMRIAWIIPDFQPGAGGHMTIFRIARYLENFGHDISFLIQNPSHHNSRQDALETINRCFQPLNADVQLFRNHLPNLHGDAIIATDRFTCYPVKAMSGFKRKFYFVQDYETAFYPMGAEALLSENTYKMGFDCLCAGDWLATMMREKYGNWACSWPLAYDPDEYFVDNSVYRDDRRIAFYARYATARRAVELGVMAFEILAKRGVEFHVDFFGADVGKMGADYSYTNHRLLSSAELGSLYREASIGVVFSATNHSLVNKEMMACGLPVVDLDVESVRGAFPNDVIQFVSPQPEAIADGIELLLNASDLRENLRQVGLAFVDGLSWERSARIVENAIVARLSEQNADNMQVAPRSVS